MVSRFFALACLVAGAQAMRPMALARRAAQPRARPVLMGRRFENNKLKMAKTQAQYAKKASYIGKKVVVAVKAGGDDPSINRALAAIIREAMSLDVPKDVIDRNIKRASESTTSDYKELTYEAYGFGGVGLIVNVLSDNNNRAAADVNTAVSKTGCKIASPGSVAFNFALRGRLCVSAELDEERALDLAIEAGCEGDVELQAPDPDGRGDPAAVKAVVLTSPAEVGMMQAALQAAGLDCSSSLVHVPNSLVEVSEEDEAANFRCIDRLEELDDVAFVEHNMAL